MFEGITHCRRHKSPSLCIILNEEQLEPFVNQKFAYKLYLVPYNGFFKKETSHKVKEVGLVRNKRLFEVQSGESNKTYLVDVSCGCGCKFASSKGIANQELCSHIKATLRYLLRNGEING